MKPTHRSYQTLVEIEDNIIKIREAQIPVKIIWGGKDFCFNENFFNEWRARFPEAAHHYFEDGGHYIVEDKKDEILSLLNDFFCPEPLS